VENETSNLVENTAHFQIKHDVHNEEKAIFEARIVSLEAVLVKSASQNAS